MPMTPKEHWKPTPDDHDYPAAQDYLSLVMPDADAAAAVKALMNAPLAHRKAKIFSAPRSWPHCPKPIST